MGDQHGSGFFIPGNSTYRADFHASGNTALLTDNRSRQAYFLKIKYGDSGPKGVKLPGMNK
jgi:hypothetical protein